MDKSSQKPHYLKHPASIEHIQLCHKIHSAPICEYGGNLYYTSLDELNIYTAAGGNPTCLTQKINSPTFKIENIDNPDALKKDRKKWSAYLNDNASVTGILVGEKKSYILAIEPYSSAAVPDVDRCYALYQYKKNGTGKLVAHYTYESINCPETIMTHNGSIYYLHRSVENDNDVYELRRLVIKD